MSITDVTVLLLFLLVLLLGALNYQMLRQNGRILLRLDELEARATSPDANPGSGNTESDGLLVGSSAPAFELPELNGTRVALERMRGQRVLLIFFDPQCRFCRQMAPDLAALPTDGAQGRPVPLIISTGDPEANRQFAREQGIHAPVLLQNAMEVSTRYGVTGTPMGYLVDSDGLIASPRAVGARALLALAEPAPPAAAASQSGSPNGNGLRGNKVLSDSRIIRTGLPAGSAAPDFHLPLLGEGELALAQFRGKPLLLVFSDPDCGPCNRLAPQLEAFHREHSALPIVMISRGTPEANRQKASEFGLSFPVVLQRHWEVSRLYGMFSTPIAFAIDAQGIISAGVATGADAILALAAQVAAQSNAKEVAPTQPS